MDGIRANLDIPVVICQRIAEGPVGCRSSSFENSGLGQEECAYADRADTAHAFGYFLKPSSYPLVAAESVERCQIAPCDEQGVYLVAGVAIGTVCNELHSGRGFQAPFACCYNLDTVERWRIRIALSQKIRGVNEDLQNARDVD